MEKNNLERLAEVGEEYLVTQLSSLYFQIKKRIKVFKQEGGCENLNEIVTDFVKYKNLKKKAIECDIFYRCDFLDKNDYKLKELIKPYELT